MSKSDFIDSEEEDGDGGDEDIQWMGYKEVSDMNNGKSFVNYEKPKLKTGELINIGSRTVRKCRGPIILFKQWWQVTFLRTRTAKDNYKEPKDRYALCYRLRDDPNCFSDHLAGLLISDILQDRMTGNSSLDASRLKFEQYLRDNRLDKDLDLFNLKERLETFSEQHADPELENERGPEEQFMRAILNSGQFKQVDLAQTHPKLLHYLPQLFPFHFVKILALKEDVMDELVQCIEEEPGNLAFKTILAKRYHVLGVETSKEALIKSGLMSIVPKKEQDAIEIYEFLKKETKEFGHTWVMFDKIMTALSKQVNLWEEAMEFLNKHKVTKTQMEAGHRIVYLQSLWKAENQIAKGLNSLIKKQELQPWNLEVDLSGEDFRTIMSDNDQCRAAKLIASDPVVAISGKGGCGKTYVVSKVLQAASANRSKNEYKAKDEEKFKCTEFDDDLTQRPADASDIEESEERCPEEVNVLLTAPTGKAANLLGKRANLTSCTLHQVIWSYRMLKPGVDWKHKDVNVLVVDECSLVSVSTMAFLLELLLKNSKLRRVVLLGDIRQLPSIEPGNFLKDTFQSLEVLGFSVELRTNHRSESQAIVDNATRISNKMFPIFDREKFIYRKLPDNNPESSGNDYMLQDINDDISKLLSHEALKCHVNSQFISFTRRVCEAVNDLCCKHYSNHRIKEHHKYLFRIGDKICCTKNGYVNLYGEKHGLMSCAKVANEGDKETAGGVDRTILTGTSNDTMMDGDTTINEEQTENQSKPSKQIRLCNGEIFFIMNEVERGTDQGRTTTFFELSEDASEDNTFWVEKRQMRKACKIRHAWARTIHTFQGSETDNVVYIVGTRSWRQNWQHVYTAVTRGRKSVFIIGQDYVLRAAIKRSEIRRQTGLKKQLLLAFQKDKKLSPTHEVNSSILCPIVGQGQNSLTKTAQWLADNPKMSFNIHSQPLISKALMKTQADLNSTQDILSSLASEHDQQAEEDDTCPPDDISDRDSPSLLDPPNKEPLSVIKSNKTFYDAKKVLPSSSKTLKSSPRSSITNDETKTKDMIEEYNSDDEGILKCLKGEGVSEAVIEEDNSDGESVKSESLLSTPAFGDGLTKIKPHTPVTKSGSCSSSLFSKSLNFNKPVDDGVSPIMLFASKRELNDCYIRTGLSPLTPNDSSIDRKQGFNSSTTSRQSPFTPLSGTHKINQIEQKTSSPLASFSVSSSVQVSSPNSVIEYPDIKEPPSNESMWSEIDESCYLDITDSQIGVDKTCLSDIGINSSHSEFSRNGSLAHQKWAGGNKQGIKLTEGASPSTFSINGCRDRFLNKTPNVNNQSSCSQWSEVDDDQYITALDLVDIENMATQVDDIEEIDRGSQSQQFNEYRQPQATPPNVDDCGKILNTTSEPSCVHGSPGIKRQLSMERTEVSPMKRRLATLKFE